MIKVLYRLKKREDFKKTYQKGWKVVGPYLILYYRKNNLDIYRIGFSVSKKVGKAVVRNRVKRILREICRLNEELFPQGWDFIFIARNRVKDVNYRVVERSLVKMVHKVKDKNNA
ncbi:MAG: ribonuclease P protein component [Bacillota bacterium]|jgi:ribonuclease P protein component